MRYSSVLVSDRLAGILIFAAKLSNDAWVECWRSRSVRAYNPDEEAHPMKTITIEIPDEMTSLCGGTDEDWRRRCVLQQPFFGTNRAGSHKEKRRRSRE